MLKRFNDAIDANTITTWSRDGDGYYTHRAEDWARKAWFKPKTSNEALIFNIIRPEDATLSKAVYDYYHGHLIETFLNHFDGDFSSGEATARPTGDDLI